MLLGQVLRLVQCISICILFSCVTCVEGVGLAALWQSESGDIKVPGVIVGLELRRMG